MLTAIRLIAHYYKRAIPFPAPSGKKRALKSSDLAEVSDLAQPLITNNTHKHSRNLFSKDTQFLHEIPEKVKVFLAWRSRGRKILAYL